VLNILWYISRNRD